MVKNLFSKILLAVLLLAGLADNVGAMRKRDREKVSAPTGQFSLTGLSNPGNSCYINAVTQCLLHLPHLNQILNTFDLEEAMRNPAITDKDAALLELSVLDAYKALSADTQAYLPCAHTDAYRDAVIQAYFKGSTGQQDAQEFLNAFLNTYETYGIATPCQRKEVSTITCEKCKTVTRRQEKHHMLSLPITGTILTIEDLIQCYTAPETLDGKAKFSCDTCKSYEVATKALSFASLPPVLAIQLKRFDNAGTKNATPVTFSQKLTLSTTSYRLHGIVYHRGSTQHEGHYTAAVKSANGWYHFDDMCSSQVSECYLSSINGGIPYLLVYVKEGVAGLEALKVGEKKEQGRIHKKKSYEEKFFKKLYLKLAQRFPTPQPEVSKESVQQPEASILYDVEAFQRLKNGDKKITGANLQGAPLYTIDNLSDVEFIDCNLNRVDCTDATMNGVKFRHCSLKNAIFERTKLNDAVFCDETEAHYAIFNFAELNRATIKNCDFLGAVFQACSNGILTYVTDNLTIEHSKFLGAKFINMKLNDAIFRHVDFTGTTMRDVYFDHGTLEHLTMIKLDAEMLRITNKTELNTIDFTSATLKHFFVREPSTCNGHTCLYHFGINLNFTNTHMSDGYFFADPEIGLIPRTVDLVTVPLQWLFCPPWAQTAEAGIIVGAPPIFTWFNENITFSKDTTICRVIFQNIIMTQCIDLETIKDSAGSDFHNVKLSSNTAQKLKEKGAIVNNCGGTLSQSNALLASLQQVAGQGMGTAFKTLGIMALKKWVGLPA